MVGDVGSSTISAPLQKAAAARAAKPSALAARAAGRTTSRSLRRKAKPRPPSATRNRANSAANRIWTSVADMAVRPARSSGGSHGGDRVAAELDQRSEGLLEGVDGDHLEVVADGRPHDVVLV